MGSKNGMQGKKMGVFSGSKDEEKSSANEQLTFELVSCPKDGIRCEGHRGVMNENMAAAKKHRINKDYQKAIIELKTAFEQTSYLQADTCQNCVKLFRSTIIYSLEAIQDDLQKMTTGFFKDKSKLPSLKIATSVLEELKKTMD